MRMIAAAMLLIVIPSSGVFADCSNRVRDPDEQGIDCGGVCSPCKPLIIDHTAVADFDKVGAEWIERAKAFYKVSYGHTSHGSQVASGMAILRSSTAYNGLYNFYDDYTNHQLPQAALSFWDCRMSGASDLGNPDFTSWATATRNHLNGIGSDRNLVIWSWCGQVDTTEANINQYLNLMNQLELDYPGVTFVYMTGHLNGTGPGGNVYARNNQIRNFCRQNNKVLFDFADIESWDPAGTYYPNESDACNWCSQWCSSHDCGFCTSSCAHSHCFNCYLKGKAFWVMMASLAGWNSGFLYGDVSGEGEISAYDAALTAQAAVALITLTSDQAKAADVDGNGEVTAYDAALIAQRAVGLIDKFPVEP